MHDPADNLLLCLHKWASGQDENFTTEAFVHLLRHLLMHEPSVAAAILYRLTGGALRLQPQEASRVSISTQVIVEEGRPDIEIRASDHLVYVEVKVQSGLGFQQLERYRRALEASRYPRTTLVLLTRQLEVLEPTAQPDYAVRWYEIAHWLEIELNDAKVIRPETRYVRDQFLGFLRERNMTVEQVTWELPRGIAAFQSLLAMMGEAVEGVNVRYKRAHHWQWIGYNIVDVRERYNFAVLYSNPGVVVFNSTKGKIDPRRATDLGIGRVWEEVGVGWRWEHQLDLTSEQVHFFALSKDSQFQRIEEFLRESLHTASMITLTGKADQATNLNDELDETEDDASDENF